MTMLFLDKTNTIPPMNRRNSNIVTQDGSSLLQVKGHLPLPLKYHSDRVMKRRRKLDYNEMPLLLISQLLMSSLGLYSERGSLSL